MYLRGDIVIVSAKGNEGKPRPCIIVQADWLNEKSPPSYLVCLMTSEIYEDLDFRPIIQPNQKNKLEKISQAMTDKIQAVKASQIRSKVGVIDKNIMEEIDRNLALLMNL